MWRRESQPSEMSIYLSKISYGALAVPLTLKTEPTTAAAGNTTKPEEREAWLAGLIRYSDEAAKYWLARAVSASREATLRKLRQAEELCRSREKKKASSEARRESREAPATAKRSQYYGLKKAQLAESQEGEELFEEKMKNEERKII